MQRIMNPPKSKTYEELRRGILQWDNLVKEEHLRGGAARNLDQTTQAVAFSNMFPAICRELTRDMHEGLYRTSCLPKPSKTIHEEASRGVSYPHASEGALYHHTARWKGWLQKTKTDKKPK